MQKREIEVVIISDVHLGTYGCHAKELLHYLQGIQVHTLFINGDFIDGWAFSKKYFPESHFAVIQQIIKFITGGTQVIYITGNHDEFLRKYTDVTLNNFRIVDKIVLQINNKKHWIFHGDIFDRSTRGFNKWLAVLGGKGYDWLIRINSLVNFILVKMGKEKYSLSKKVKDRVKQAVKYISDFEQMAAEQAIFQGYDAVICGHIHNPQQKTFVNDRGTVQYLNSGDWVENLTALEFYNNEWHLYHHPENEKQIPGKSRNETTVFTSEVEILNNEYSTNFLKFYLKHNSL